MGSSNLGSNVGSNWSEPSRVGSDQRENLGSYSTYAFSYSKKKIHKSNILDPLITLRRQELHYPPLIKLMVLLRLILLPQLVQLMIHPPTSLLMCPTLQERMHFFFF